MNILFDHQVFSYQVSGGISRYFAELYRRLPSHNWQPKLGMRYTANQYLRELEPELFQPLFGNWHVKGKSHVQSFLNRGVSSAALRAGQFDVFHPTYYDPYFLNYLGRHPFVITVHDMIHELFPDEVSDARQVQDRKRKLVEAASSVIAISEHTKADLVRLLGLSPDKIHVIYHGNSLLPASITPQAPAHSLPEQFLLFVGHRHAYKNFRTALQVFRLCKERFSELGLVCAGGGAWGPDETTWLSDFALEGSVHQMDVSDTELAWLYGRARCLIYPSRYEGFGLPLVEAQAWQCPIVAADASCLPEIGGDYATYADPDDVEKLASLVQEYLLGDMRPAAPSAPKDHFSWDETVRQTAKVYESVL